MKKNTIVSDSFYLTLVKVITTLTGMLQTMILSRTLSVNDYGTYSQGLLIISLSVNISILGLNDAVNYFYNKDKRIDVKKKYINTIFGLECIIGCIVGLFILIFQNLIIDYFQNPAIKYFVIYIAFRPLLTNLITMYQVLFISDNKASIVMWRNLVISFLQLFFVYMIQKVSSSSIIWLFVLLLGLEFFQVIFFAGCFRKWKFGISFYKITEYKEVLKWSLPVALGIAISSLMTEMDKLFIGKVMSTEMLGLYTNVSRPLPFSIFTAALATIIAPYTIRMISQKQYEEIKMLLSNYYQIAYTISFSLAIGGIVCSPELIKFLYSEKYLDGIDVFNIYIIVAALNFAFFGLLITACGKTKWLMIYSGVGLALNIILNMIFFKIMGMKGPAFATLICTICINILQLKQGINMINGKLLSLLNLKGIFILMIKLSIAAVAGIFIRSYFIAIDWHYLLVLIITFCSYIVIALILNAKKIITLVNVIRKIQ